MNMSYEPTNWKDGDLVTSAKLNKMEQGIANGVLVVGCTETKGTITLDKTWKQIYDADYAVCVEKVVFDGNRGVAYYPIAAVMERDGEYIVGVVIQDSPKTFTAETENDYPIAEGAPK
jgi:hypothetical protein